VCVWKEGHQIPISVLLVFEAILRLTRRWRKGDTKAIKVTENIFIFYSYLVTCLVEFFTEACWVSYDQCLALSVYVEAKNVVLQYV